MTDEVQNTAMHRMKTNKTFECPICGRKFHTDKGKKTHLERHGKDRDRNTDLNRWV